ncbi:MAG TPA: PHP domain-containing protein [Planctomycetota bacterium]
MRRLTAVLILLTLVPIALATRPPALREYRGILHCHSLHSHDSKGTYEEILAAAKAAKIDFIAMTDHPPKDETIPFREGWRGLHDGVLFLQGAEYAGQHLLAVGTREPVHGSTAEKIEAIHRQGGLAFLSHPEEVEDWTPYAAADGVEIYNVHAALKKRLKEPGFIPEVLRALKADPETSFQLLRRLDPDILAKWDAVNRIRPFTGIAANDAHQNTAFFGTRLDPYPRAFRFVTTRVRAAALTEAAILDALRAGRCRVEFSDAPDPRDVETVVVGARRELWIRKDGERRPWILENWKR